MLKILKLCLPLKYSENKNCLQSHGMGRATHYYYNSCYTALKAKWKKEKKKERNMKYKLFAPPPPTLLLIFTKGF